MIKGIGNDIIEISRIKSVIERQGKRFLDRVFTLSEQQYCLQHKESERHFAGRFAAKEAIVKALGTGLKDGLTWLDFEILNDEKGKPVVHISPVIENLIQKSSILISISHCKEYATAFAIIY
jgi:holo-[acyl-carrier protein] synthase